MKALRAVWGWLRKWWKVIVPALGGALVVALGAALAVGAYRRKVAGLRDALEVERALREVEVLRARREELLAQDDRDEEKVREIDVALEENRLAIETARRRADVPDDELAEEFARLGY